jgi:hypothetical protein
VAAVARMVNVVSVVADQLDCLQRHPAILELVEHNRLVVQVAHLEMVILELLALHIKVAIPRMRAAAAAADTSAAVAAVTTQVVLADLVTLRF